MEKTVVVILCDGEKIRIIRKSKPTVHVYHDGFELVNTPSHRIGGKRKYEPRPWGEEPRRGHC